MSVEVLRDLPAGADVPLPDGTWATVVSCRRGKVTVVRRGGIVQRSAVVDLCAIDSMMTRYAEVAQS